MSRITDLASKANDIKTVLEPIPEWTPPGDPLVHIGIRSMTGTQRSQYVQELIERDNEGGDRTETEYKIMVLCCFDPEDGLPCFTEADIPMLKTKSGAVLSRLSMQAVIINNLDNKADERLGKDSSVLVKLPVPAASPGATQSGDSISS